MNPFSLPRADPDLYLLREQQRSAERANTAEQRSIPVHLRSIKKPNQIVEELKKLPSAESSFQKNQRSRSYNRENIQELILRKREILLTKKKIEHKQNSIIHLNSITQTQEEEHRKAAKSLEDNLLRVEKYEENLKTEAKKKADLAEKKIKERIEKQIEINILISEIDSLYGAVERKTEELKHLCVYKDFVEELSMSNDRPDLDSKKSKTFITERKTDDLQSSSFLLQSINSLEQKNLFLIQQAQEAEQNLENLKSKTQAEKKVLEDKNEKIKNNIKNLEKNKEAVNLKILNLVNEQSEKPLVSEETMVLIHQSLVQIFELIGGDLTMFPSDFGILESLENAIRAEIEKTK